MKKITALALTMCLLIASLMPYQSYALETDGSIYDQAELKAADRAQMLTTTYGAVSVQYALADGGEIRISGHSGVYAKDENMALTENHMYGIGSASKMFVTAAVMKLSDEGKLDIDAPVVDYIPDFSMVDERYRDITPRMLLNHSSGLYGSTFVNGFLLGDNDTYVHDTFLEKLSEQRLKADPGEFSVYCNDGFTLAEILVERVSGQDFTTYIHENFTVPLNMNRTMSPTDDFDRKDLVRAYSAFNGAKMPDDTVNIIGTGGLYSTAEDLCRFAALFDGSSDILSEESVKAMENPEYADGIWPESGDSAIGYGLGWDSVNLYPFSEYGIKAVVKGGDTQLFHSSVVVLPEYNMSASVVSSGGSSVYNQLLAVDMLLDVLEAKGVTGSERPEKSFDVPSADYGVPEADEKYLGSYIGTQQFIKLGKNDEGALTVSQLNSPAAEPAVFKYDGNGGYVSEWGTEKISFVEESNGHTYIWSQNYASVPGFTQTASSAYVVQKAEPYTPSAEVQEAWNVRNGKLYLQVNEKYTSQNYSYFLPIAAIGYYDDLPGYLTSTVLSEKDRAENAVQVPGSGGRDVSDFVFITENGVEYLLTRGNKYADLSSFTSIYGGSDSVCTIQNNGYARWYMVGPDSANRTMKAVTEGVGGFNVYDANGMCVYSTVVNGGDETVLPESGYVVFIGEPNTVFDINMSE